MSSLAKFPWPCLPGVDQAPRWNGTEFEQPGGARVRVLAYDSQESHWNEDLTTFHETEAGEMHPIDVASRIAALATLRRVPANGVIMDVGCSSGFLLRDLRAELPGRSIIGADFILGLLERLARNLPGLPILQFDLRKCPLPDACLDGIANINVLEHIDRDGDALAHLFRILKPGGWLHLEVPAGPHLFDAYDEHLMHHRRYRMTDLRAQAARAGFECARATHLGFVIYPLFAWTKRRCRARLAAMSSEEKQRWVAAQISRTRRSPLLGGVFHLERILGRFVSYPIGVRCVLVLRKPV